MKFQSLQIFYIILLRAEIVTTFGSKMVTISTCNKKTSTFTTFRDQILPDFITCDSYSGRIAITTENIAMFNH